MKGLLRAACVAAVLAWGSIAIAQSAELLGRKVRVSIASQSVSEALQALAKAADFQLIVPMQAVDGMKSPGAVGEFTVREALDAVLAGLPLSYTLVNEGTLSIEGRKEPMRVDLDALNAAAVEVTGSRLTQNPRADGTVATPGPVAILNRAELDSFGISSVSDALRYLPQQPYGPRPPFASPSSAGLVELRGLGIGATLPLINGRRTVSTASLIAYGAFDLNAIPLAAVERIEVLSDSSSAVYGTDAIGGVINVILKRDISRPTLDLHYGGADGGAVERRATASVGFDEGALHAMVIADYMDNGGLLGEKRRWHNQDYRRYGGRDERAATANPGNVSSLNGENLPGLSSSFAAVPIGSSGLLTPADFVNTADTVNRESLYRYWSAVPASRRRGLIAAADFDVSSTINAFAEMQYSDGAITTQYEPATRHLIVPATNPFNPFGIPVAVDYLFSGVGPTRFELESKMKRFVAGIRGERSLWNWDLSVLRITDSAETQTMNNVDDARVRQALAEVDPSRALNVFEDGPGGSPELLTSLVSNRPGNAYSSSGTQVAAVARGALAALPAGNVEVVVGAESLWSREHLSERLTSLDADRSVSAIFAEARAPLVDASMDIPGISELALTVAARADHYSDFGIAFNPQFGFLWRPVDDVMVRASYGTSFRAPSLYELYAPRTDIPDLAIPDPLRNGEISATTFTVGGNPELQPIEATSLTAGFVLTPNAIPALQVSATYWRIHMSNQVRVLPFNIVLSNPERFADRIDRSERTPEDIAAGLPGKLIGVDISRINFGDIESDGLDVGVKYSVETKFGDFTQSASATWVHGYETVDFPGTAATERLGIATPLGTIARWRGVATLSWKKGGLTLSTTARYTAGAVDVDFLTGERRRRIGAQIPIDVQAAGELDRLHASAWLDGVVVTAGITNIANEDPPFAEIGGAIGFDTLQGDLRGRFGYLRLSKSF